MASNVTQISGATEIKLYFRNYTYSSALSDMDALEMVNFTDIDRVGYKNTAGTLRKFLEDASTSSNLTADSVLFTDANGRATVSAEFTFDGTYLTLPQFLHGWQLVASPTKLEIYKDGSPTGVVLAES